jgi:hypothetical protein
MAEPNFTPEPPSRERQPRQGVDRSRVRSDDRAHVADEHVGASVLEPEADTPADPRHWRRR